MKKTLYIISIFATLILISCSTDQPVESVVEQTTETNLVKLTPAQMQNANIETGKPERRNISATLQVNGVMEAPPQNIVSVSVPLGGYLKRIELMPGMHLKKGQLMAELEDQAFIELQQDYLTAKARLAYLEDEFARQRDLNQSKATSDKVYQQTLSE
ncbi:hypothetical protein ACSX1A_09865 [Pontibacter sp. MBLB2868]|uniref:hypothetical protein n=1 Tax=Pontibacter sp. MBLB2868 TaxID=3451555 RepID=UPI003F74E27B